MIQWNVDSLDWQEPTKEQLIKKVCEHKNLSPGSIILMHTGTKCTKQALKQIIKNIKAKGYEFVPVSRLIYRRDYRIDPTGKTDETMKYQRGIETSIEILLKHSKILTIK